MQNIIIVGGDISGLICAYIFNQRKNTNVIVLEPNNIGGEFVKPGLKHINFNQDVVNLFDKLDILYSEYHLHTGILLRDQILTYPSCFNTMTGDEKERVLIDFYKKTRKTEPDINFKNSIIDHKSKKAIRINPIELVKKLSKNINFKRSKLKEIYKDKIVVDNGVLKFDYLILTLPLWEIKKCIDWYIPHAVAMRKNIILVNAKNNHYMKWDYIYTPYTPANSIYKFSHYGQYYIVETVGLLNRVEIVSDLNFIFKDGWYVVDLIENLKGYLLPLEETINWPDNIAVLGKYAKWKPTITFDVTFKDAQKLLHRWF